MKIRSKLSITMMAAVLGMVGCQKSNIVGEPDGAQVQFSPYIGKSGAVTKGSPLSEFKLGDRFNVYAFNGQSTFFDGVTVTQSGDKQWTYSPVKMWPTDGALLNFYAYAPMSNGNVKPTITSAAQTFELTVPAEVSQHADLLVASTLGVSNADVSLTFKHVTSQVSIKALKDVGTGDANKVKVRVSKVRVGTTSTGDETNGLVSKGVYTLGNNTWALGADKVVYMPELTHAASIDLTLAPVPITGDNQSMFLIPQTLASKWMYVDYEYSLDGGFAWTKYTAKIDLGDKVGKLDAGKHHVLTLKLSASRNYSFEATIEDWEQTNQFAISPLSIDVFETKDANPTDGTFDVYYSPKGATNKGYSLESDQDWLKLASEAGLSFEDAKAQKKIDYAGMGMTRADVNSPAQDWYIYLAGNPTKSERRGTITVKFQDETVQPAILTVVQKPSLNATNVIWTSRQICNFYVPTGYRVGNMTMFNVKSNNPDETKQTVVTMPAGMNVFQPTSPFALSKSIAFISSLETSFTTGSVVFTTDKHTASVPINCFRDAHLSPNAIVRPLPGKYKYAGLVTGRDWVGLTFDPTGANAGAEISGTEDKTVYMVVSANTGTARTHTLLLTNLDNITTFELYYQAASTATGLPLTGDAGTLYFFGGYQGSGEEMINVTSTDASTNVIKFSSTGGYPFTAGGADWTPAAAGETRALKTQFRGDMPDGHIAITSVGKSPFYIPIKWNGSLEKTASKVFIPGSYNSATVTSGDATVSDAEDSAGSQTLTSVTNNNGLWIHYTANTGGTRRSRVVLTNTTDWTKSSVVLVAQNGDFAINHNADYSDVAHPVQWAGSNIYIGTDGQPTFDDVNQTLHSDYRGVFFCWGGLTAIAPTIRQGAADEILWRASEFTGTDKGLTTPNYGTTQQLFTPQITVSTYDPANGKGDICRYMTQKGIAPLGKKWRMPTSMEISHTAKKGLVSVYPLNFAPDDVSDASEGKAGPKDLGRGRVAAGVTMGGTFMPASGWKKAAGDAVVQADLRFWASTISKRDFNSASCFDVNPKTLSSAHHSVPYLYSPGVDRLLPVRCVVDEDSTY